MIDHEEALIRAFMRPERRARYLTLLANPKRRGEMLERLNHHFDFIDELSTPLSGDANMPTKLVAVLRSKGAGATCRVFADEDVSLGRDMRLEEACELAYQHFFAIILSCVPGRLAYFKPEDPSHGFILEKS